MSRKNERRYTSAKELADKQKGDYGSTFVELPDGITAFKPKIGTMLLDIIPFVAGKNNPNAKEGEVHWERTVWVHQGIGVNGAKYICPAMTHEKPCPICKERARLTRHAKDEEDEEQAKELQPKKRNLILVRNLKDPDKGYQLWDISYHLFAKQLYGRIRSSDEEDEWDKFFFLNDGLTLRIGFGEKTFNGHTFAEVDSIDFRSRKEQYDEDEVLNEVPCLDDIIIEEDYDKLKKIFEAGSEDDNEDEDEKPKGRSRDSDRKRSSRDNEEDDDDSDDVDDEDDEDAVPAKRGKTRSSRDEDEDEEDDEPRSKKSSKARREAEEEEEFEEDADDAEDDTDEEEEDRPSKKNKGRGFGGGKMKAEPMEDDDDDEDEPKKSSSKSSSKTSSRSRDEDENDDSPKARSGKGSSKESSKSSKSSKEDDVDEDWGEFDKDKEDEEEDERPAKKRR